MSNKKTVTCDECAGSGLLEDDECPFCLGDGHIDVDEDETWEASDDNEEFDEEFDDLIEEEIADDSELS